MLNHNSKHQYDIEFLEKRMKVANLTKDPLLQIEMFENEPAKDRVLQLISVAQQSFLYTRDTIEIHSSDLNLIFRAMSHLARLAKDDLSDFDYCYVLSSLDHVTNKLLKSYLEIKTYSDSPMIRSKNR